MRFNSKHWDGGKVSLHKLLNLNAKQPTVMTHALNLRSPYHNLGVNFVKFWVLTLYSNTECLFAGANYISMCPGN